MLKVKTKINWKWQPYIQNFKTAKGTSALHMAWSDITSDLKAVLQLSQWVTLQASAMSYCDNDYFYCLFPYDGSTLIMEAQNWPCLERGNMFLPSAGLKHSWDRKGINKSHSHISGSHDPKYDSIGGSIYGNLYMAWTFVFPQCLEVGSICIWQSPVCSKVAISHVNTRHEVWHNWWRRSAPQGVSVLIITCFRSSAEKKICTRATLWTPPILICVNV